MNKLSIKRTKQLLTSHPLTKIPKHIQEEKNKIILISIISTILGDLFSFSLKGAYHFSSLGITALAVTFLLLYFAESIFRDIYYTYAEVRRANFDEMYKREYNTIITDTVNIVRNKVYKNEKLMDTPSLIFSIKGYLDLVYNFIWKIPEDLVNFLMLLIMIISLMVMEFKESSDIKLTSIFFVILLFCTIIYGILLKFRIKTKRNFATIRKDLSKQEEIFLNDVKNTEPIDEHDFLYHAQKLKDCITKNTISMRDENFKLNRNFIAESVTLSVFMIVIMVLKLQSKTLDSSTIFDIVATTTIYQKILSKIQKIMKNLENSINMIQDMEVYSEDFFTITQVLDVEEKYKMNCLDIDVDKILISKFIYKYPSTRNVFKLLLNQDFELSKGDVLFVHGHTGCGKSTLMRLITGKIKLLESPVTAVNKFGETVKGYLVSVMLEAKSSLGSNNILQEIILSDNIEQINRRKFFKILEGVTLYEDFESLLHIESLSPTEKDNKILEYLKNSTYKQFSTGQQQRLLISKVLYNLSNQQIIAFDEITSGLDYVTAKKVLDYIIEFCNSEQQRILIFASHQVSITRSVCNKQVTFENKAPFSEIKFSRIK